MTLLETHAEIANHCAEIARLFKPGAQVTVLVRNPEHGLQSHSADMIVTDDDFEAIRDSLTYLQSRQEQVLPQE